ncbi:MAG: tetratricopeptide repeat protein, partial [Thermoanaerobaculia bacterium]|nr:tetratricopeptide repeat protein [Thermoanaerobaculia bacterium]
EQLERALAAYDRAAAIAPSDPEVARAAAQVAVLYAAWELLKGEDLQPVLDRGLRSAEQALAADLDDARSWLWKARLERLSARSLQVRSKDPLPRLEEAAAAAERAAALLPDASEARLELARILWARAQGLRERGEDVTAGVEQTIAALSRVAPPWRDYAFFFYLGSAHMTLGDQRQERGEQATASFDAAIAAFQNAAELHSAPFAALSNLGVCLFKKSALREAAAVFEKARALDPAHVAPPYYLGQIYLRLAQGGNAASGLLGEEVGRALESYRLALALNPRMVVLHNAIGELHHLQAIHAWEQGEDSEPYFALARKQYAEGLAETPGHAMLHQNLAWTAYFQAKVRLRSGRGPGPHLDEALNHARRALELSKLPGALLCVGSVYRLTAEAAVRDGRDPSRWLERSQEALRELLALNPNHPEALRSLGRLYTLEAQWRASTHRDATEAFERAHKTLDRALELEPEVAYFHLALARWRSSVIVGDPR